MYVCIWVCIGVLVLVCVNIHVNGTMMVFKKKKLYSINKHLKPVASHVRATFTCCWNHFCLSIKRHFAMCILSCWSEYFTLVPLSPFIRHPLSKFTLRS